MAYEIRLGDRVAKIVLHNRVGDKAIIEVDDQVFEVDIVQVEKGVYSILWKGKSFNVELINDDSAKNYIVNTFSRTYDAEIIDAETKYQQNRSKGFKVEEDKNISSPMPGKVIKIPVKTGDTVIPGQTLLVVEAMKMQSEFKAVAARTVVDILVKEGDTINAHQLLMKLE